MAFWLKGVSVRRDPSVPEGITRRPYQKAITEGHNRKPITEDHFQPEGHLQSEDHQTRRSYQKATSEGNNRRLPPE